MNWKSVEKKMNEVNRAYVPWMMANQDDERWIEICNKWNDAYEILKVIEAVVKEYES